MSSIKLPIYLTQQIRDIERLAAERFDILPAVLMQRAGQAAFEYLQHRWPTAKKIAVICGAGNNGGDGYVLAKFAHESGLAVTIWQIGNHGKKSAEANNAYQFCLKAAVPIFPFTAQANLQHPDVIVDAMCGIGVQSVLREEVLLAIEKISQTNAAILSIDIPSGIHADTGQILGSAISAAATVTFIGLKLGLFTGSGITYSGEVICYDLDLPSELFSYVEPIAEKIHLNCYTSYLHPRARNWHKGLSGHVLMIGGALGFAGAICMAAAAALRVGAGLVSVATHPEHAALISMTCPEIMSHGVKNEDDLLPLFAKATVIVVGPGLQSSCWAKNLWLAACQQSLPILLDADGLNLLSATSMRNDHWVLTPHPGEAARLLQTTSEHIQRDRLHAVQSIQQRYGGVCVLKGAGSLIMAEHDLPALCDQGNPGMSTAGMGDILSGVIAGFIAQNIPLHVAAKLGVCLHAIAGDLAAKEGERGMIATDLLPYLRRMANFSFPLHNDLT